MAHPKIPAFVLAGGRGKRLAPLTDMRTKPSVPFGGRYRIVDFVLSNLLRSQIYSMCLLVQYKSQSLIDALQSGEDDQHDFGRHILPSLIDSGEVIAAGASIGFDPERDRREGRFHIDSNGIVVMPKAERLRRREPRER